MGDCSAVPKIAHDGSIPALSSELLVSSGVVSDHSELNTYLARWDFNPQMLQQLIPTCSKTDFGIRKMEDVIS